MEIKHSATAFLAEKTYKTAAKIRDFNVVVDEPIEAGGTNTSPTPMEYLKVALASCVAITLRMYVTRKGWDLGKIEVKVDQIDIEDGYKFVKNIKFDIQPTEDQLKRIANITEKCPVAKALKNGVTQETIFL